MADTKQGGVYKDAVGDGYHNARGEALDPAAAEAATEEIEKSKDPKARRRGEAPKLDTAPVPLADNTDTEEGEDRGSTGRSRPATDVSREQAGRASADTTAAGHGARVPRTASDSDKV